MVLGVGSGVVVGNDVIVSRSSDGLQVVMAYACGDGIRVVMACVW